MATVPLTNEPYVYSRSQMKEMTEATRKYIEQEYVEKIMTEKEFKNWWLYDETKTLPFETLESDLEQEITCPKCKEKYKLKYSKVAEGSNLHDTKNVCKNFPQCSGETMDLYLHLFDNDPEPNE